MPNQMFIDFHKKYLKVAGKGIETNKLTSHHSHHEESHDIPIHDHHIREQNNPHMHEEHLHRHLNNLHISGGSSKNKRITLKF